MNLINKFEPASYNSGDKELRAIGVRAGVGHGQVAWSRVLNLEVFVGKFVAINRFAASSISSSEVSSLLDKLCEP
jgi:hypothetical protein